MSYHKKGRKFGRKKDERQAFLASLAEALIERGRIRTTEARARALRPFVEKLVTKARVGTIASQRLAAARLGTHQRARKLFKEIAPKYKDRPGGYLRITKLARRGSDGSRMAVIEFV